MLDRNAEGWKVEEKRKVTRKECKGLKETIEDGGIVAQTDMWNFAKKRMLEDRGAMPRKKGDLVREHQASHEENWRR